MAALDLLASELGIHGRTLRRAADEGAIRATRLSPRKLTLSPAEESYVLRTWPLLGRLRSLLRTERNVRLAVLYGSRARGDERPDSDVDLLVVLGDSSIFRQIALEHRLGDALGLSVHLAVVADARRSPGLLASAIEDGRVLVDRDGDWRTLLADYPSIARAADAADMALRASAKAAIAELTASPR
jgi:predicted nucleotidyltransferase